MSGLYNTHIPFGDKTTLIKNADNSFTRTYSDKTTEYYNLAGYMVSVSDKNGNVTTLTRDSNNKLTNIIDAAGRTYSITYNTNNFISQILLPNGKVINYTYNYIGLQNVTYPDQSFKTYEYFVGQLSGVKDENQKYIAKYTYDSNLHVATSSVDGNIDKLTYSTTDPNHTTVTDALGNSTTYTIDKSTGKSIPLSISGSGCSECGTGNVTYTYDSKANVISSTDANGNITTYTYDAKGNMLTKTEASGTSLQRTTTYTYDTQWNVPLTVTDPMGNTTTFEYDNKGNLVAITDADNNETDLTRNQQGLITEISWPDESTIDIIYDQYGNVATVTDEVGNTSSYSYDIMGNVLSRTDGQGNATNYTYDLRGRITELKDALNQVTNFSYDPAGHLIGLTDPKGNQTVFSYDNGNRLAKETDPLGKQTSYSYDVMDNISSTTDANGKTTAYTYDSHNHVISATYGDNTSASFSYDPNGNLTTAANQNISYTFTYDALNRKTSITDSLNRALSYSYDLNSNLTSSTNPGGTITYTYNDLNRVVSLNDGPGSTYTFGYDARGRRNQKNYPNGIATTYTYDSANRLTDMITLLGNDPLSWYNYVYDKVGNATQLSDLNSGAHTYSYDLIYRLTQATHPDQSAEQYSYDAVGNRLGTTVLTNNEVTQDSNFNYVYDNNGNLTQKTNRSTGQVTTYTWDGQNRLTQVSFPGSTTTFKYDPFGRRIEKNNGSVTRYLYDGPNVILTYDGNNQVLAKFTHGPGVDEPLSVTANGNKFYYHADRIGSIRNLSDYKGNIVQSYTYDSFGNIKSVLDPNISKPYAFTGREWDKETGLYYCRARYYDPMEGRFISKDPIGFVGGDVNLYGYVQNNPVNLFDPYGLASTPVVDILNGLEFGFRAAGVVVWEGKKAATQEAVKALAAEYLSKLLRLSEPSSFLLDKIYTGSQIPYEASSMKEMAERISIKINNVKKDVYKCKIH